MRIRLIDRQHTLLGYPSDRPQGDVSEADAPLAMGAVVLPNRLKLD